MTVRYSTSFSFVVNVFVNPDPFSNPFSPCSIIWSINYLISGMGNIANYPNWFTGCDNYIRVQIYYYVLHASHSHAPSELYWRHKISMSL